MEQANLEMAERHVCEGKDRVKHQLALVNKLDAERRFAEARLARDLLAALTDNLDAAKRHLQIIQHAWKPKA